MTMNFTPGQKMSEIWA